MNQDPTIAAAASSAVEAVVATASSPSNKMSTPAVTAAEGELRENIERAIAETPEVKHVTNTEDHFWQKRTFWAVVYSGASALFPATDAFLKYMNNHAVDGKVTAGTIFFAAIAGYAAARAGIAKVPLGSKTTTRYPMEK